MGGRMLYVAQVADALACSRQWVYELIREGELTAIRKGSYLRVPEESVRAFLDRHKVDPDQFDLSS